MPQAPLKQPYTVVTVSCSHCQQEQVVHTQAYGGIWSMAHQFVKCLKCEQEFAVMVPDAIIGGPFFPERPAAHSPGTA
jgi:transcription elongation factor Elf1